jgi:type I restriction enzyme S subunit
MVLRGQIAPEFVRYYLVASKEYAESLASGTTFLELSGARMKTLELPVAPVNEQRRIAAKLDELRARSRKAREALDEVPALLDKLKQSVLAAAFRGDLTAEWRAAHPDVEPASVLLERIRVERRRRWEAANPRKKYVEPEPVDTDGLPELPEGWCWAGVEEVTEFVTSGSRGWGEFYSETGARFLRVGNLKHNTVELDLRDVALVQPPDGAEGTRTRVLRDDVLLSITADVGMVGHVSVDLGETYINQHVALMRPVPGLHQRCFAYALADPMGLQRVVRDVQYGMTKASLSLVQVRSFPVPMPPALEAVVLSAALDAALHSIDAQLFGLSEAHSALTSLDQSLLARAFRGELVPQDPNDEPADALLARIKAAAGDTTTKKRGDKKEPRPKGKPEANVLTRKDTTPTHLAAILKERGPLAPEALWKASNMDIDDFYDQLKDEEARGLLRETGRDSARGIRMLELIP